MTNSYPIRFSAQLRQHLRALRSKRGLTQAQLGALVGVSQARIAEIEASPGLVSFEQLMQLLSALDVTVSLDEAPSTPDAAKQAFKGTEATSTYQAGKVVEPSTVEQIRQALDATSSERIRQALDATSSEQIRKLVESLNQTKKGSW